MQSFNGFASSLSLLEMHGKTFQFMPILDKDLSLADPHPTLFRNVQCRNNSVGSAKSGDPFNFAPFSEVLGTLDTYFLSKY